MHWESEPHMLQAPMRRMNTDHDAFPVAGAVPVRVRDLHFFCLHLFLLSEPFFAELFALATLVFFPLSVWEERGIDSRVLAELGAFGRG
jgi:hypothetical protein